MTEIDILLCFCEGSLPFKSDHSHCADLPSDQHLPYRERWNLFEGPFSTHASFPFLFKCACAHSCLFSLNAGVLISGFFPLNARVRICEDTVRSYVGLIHLSWIQWPILSSSKSLVSPVNQVASNDPSLLFPVLRSGMYHLVTIQRLTFSRRNLEHLQYSNPPFLNH